MKASGVSFTPAASALLLEARAQLLELGDVGLVELRDVRDVDPAGVQARPGDALDARQRLGLDRTELREIHRRHLRCSRRRRRRGRGRRAAGQRALHERLDVIVGDAALEAAPGHARQVDAELARERAHRGTRVRAREARLVDRAPGPVRIRGSARRAGESGTILPRRSAAAGAGAAAAGGTAARASRRGAAAVGCGAGGAAPQRRGMRSPFTRHDHVAGVDRAALGDVDLLDHAARGRGHVHGGLVGLERDERRVHRDRRRRA